MRATSNSCCSVIVLCLLVGAFVFSMPFAGFVLAGSPGAYFTSVKATDGNGMKQVLGGGTAKVYSNQAPVREDTIFFNNITSSAWSIFFEVINVTSGGTSFSFKGDTINVSSRSSGSFSWQESGGFSGSGIIHIRIELWWNNSGTTLQENAVQFDFLVVLLTVTGWIHSQASVQRGFGIPVLLTLNFTNGGNDIMYNSSLTLLDSAGLSVQPYVRAFGNLQSTQGVGTGFSITAPSSSAVGTHSVLFRVSFADFRSVQHATNETAIVNVVRLGSQISVNSTPTRVKVGSSATLRVSLVDNNGNPVANAAVSLNIGSLPQVLLQTDSVGNAVYLYQARNGSGVFLLRVSFPGDSNLGSSTGTSILTVDPLQTTVTLSAPNSAILGQSIAFSASLLDETGNPVVGANLTFLVNGIGVGWVFTDASGVGVLYYFVRMSGTVQVRAAYLGSATYGGATSGPASVSVSPASLFIIAGLDLTLPILVALALIVFVLTARSLRAHWRV